MVASSPGNFRKRQFIRDTWANTTFDGPVLDKSLSCKVIFVLGLPYSGKAHENESSPLLKEKSIMDFQKVKGILKKSSIFNYNRYS